MKTRFPDAAPWAAATTFLTLFACGELAPNQAELEIPSQPSQGDTETQQDALLYDAMGSTKQNGFAAQRLTHGWFCIGNEACEVGDFNGDGRDDLLTILPNGTVYVAISSASGLAYSSTSVWASNVGRSDATYTIGDVDGDGRDDIVRVLPTYGYVYVAFSTGSGFASPRFIRSGLCRTGEVCRAADVNADGRADLVRFIRDTRTDSLRGDVQVALSSGTTFATPTTWLTDFCLTATEQCEVGDFTGDGAADVVAYPSRATSPDGGAWIALSNRANVFTRRSQALTHMCSAGYACTTGDADGDGRDDLIVFANGTGFSASGYDYRDDVHVSHFFPTFTAPFIEASTPRIRTETFCPAGHVCRVGDMNGDGRADLVAFVRDSLGGSARGDVLVALSTYGDPQSFTLDFDSIRAAQTEGNSDQPLLLAFFFRSTFGRNGSTVVTPNTYNENFARGIVAGGPAISIPSSVGQHTFTNVVLRSPTEVMTGRPMEVLGAAAVMIEKDLTAAAAYPGLMAEVQRALQLILERTIEQTSMFELAVPGGFEATLRDAAFDLIDDVAVSVIDNVLHFALSAPWDPDDIINFQVVLFPAVDKSMGDVLPASPAPDMVQIAIPGDGWLGHYFRTLVFQRPGESLRTTVSTRMR